MPTVRFKRAFRYHPKGKAGVTVKQGDVVDVSDAVAKSAVESGAGTVLDLAAEKAEKEEVAAEKAKKAAAEEVELDLKPEAEGDGKTAPPEDKSMDPAEDKADTEE